MTDAPSAPALPGAHGGARPAGSARAPRPAARRVIAGALLLGLVSAAHPPAAGAQRAHVASPRLAMARPTVPAAAAEQDAAAGADAPTGTAPDPRLAPDAVVAIVLDALAQADAGEDAAAAAEDADAGGAPAVAGPVALVFAFASPGNRAAAGSLERFAAMVRDDAYRPLLHHRRAARGLLRVDGDRATQRVVVTTVRGERVAYTFVLARQQAGAQRGCWLTESVTREAPSRLASPYSA